MPEQRPEDHNRTTSEGAGVRKRCSWSEGDPLLRAYHDREWGVPLHDARALWEALTLEGFQAGLAWITVLRKRDTFRAAFDGFDPVRVARYDTSDIDRLMSDAGIIRSRAKIEGAIAGARAFLQLQETGGDFCALAWSFTQGKTVVGDGHSLQPSTPLSMQAAREFKRLGFKFVGPTTVHAWMQAVGIVNDHEDHCFRRAEVTA